jgi:hypothetical protein
MDPSIVVDEEETDISIVAKFLKDKVEKRIDLYLLNE